MLAQSCLLYCRAGFEKEAAAEIMQLAQQAGIQGYVKARPDTAFVLFYPTSPLEPEALNTALNFSEMVFARQLVLVSQHIQGLPENDRVTPLLASVEALQCPFHDVVLEPADTNEGKQLSSFLKKFSTPLRRALEKKQLLQASSPWRLHLFFIDSSEVHVGLAHNDNSSPHTMGILRLKMPGAAPSRSTLKLDEAFLTMLNTQEQEKYLRNGMTAVDLGACPGGWTWQLVKRDIRVIAIDNGPMNDTLMASGMVEHIRADGFKYLPSKPVDWLVCDMVERPLHITRLMLRWLREGHCLHACFNLKLPMKKRYDMIIECRDVLRDGLADINGHYRVTMRQLYHDREEITCMVIKLN